MAGVADTPTIFLYVLHTFANLLATQLAQKSPPRLVISLSCGLDEEDVSNKEMDWFNTNAIKMGAIGVTIVAAAGDDGVTTSRSRGNPSKCRYNPLYPATSPYVLSVGGTQVCLNTTLEILSFFPLFTIRLIHNMQYMLLAGSREKPVGDCVSE